MNYMQKSFSVSVSMSQEAWDRIFKPKAEDATAPTVTTSGDLPPGESADGSTGDVTAPAPDYSGHQCASCLERGSMDEAAPGLLQCGICLARFPIGVEQARRVTGDAACPRCDGTGRLRTTFTAFACGECGGTGARKP
jgi:ribosomal protein L37AE/L43A